MIPRGELDIDWFSLLAAAVDGFGRTTDAVVRFDPEVKVCGTLSVRSGLDAVLCLSAWPAGSEIMMSAVNIPAMSAIITEHGFVPVAVDVSPSTLAPDIQQVESRITGKTRAILVAHLFGSHLDLGPLRIIADAHGVELWEDVAQGFHQNEHRADSPADISFFSFGLIKTHTALGGALVRFRSVERTERFHVFQSTLPPQRISVFRRRILRAAVLKLLGQHACYTVMSLVVSAWGGDLDVLLSDALRGFKSGPLLSQLRYRPSAAQLRLLACRLADVSGETAARKARIAADYRRLLPRHGQVGLAAAFPSHWVFPILSRQPGILRDQLWRRGFDATVRGSQLRVIPAPATHPEWDTPQASKWVPQLLYLPMHRTLTKSLIHDITSIVTETERMEEDPHSSKTS